jgi:selenide,water dikinase
VVTADFITPVVDDPAAFGAIAAANALSDIYAMGADPILVINLAGFPREALDLTVLTEIQSAAAAVVHEAGAITVGGHSIDDPELKFGLSVVGRIHPDEVVRNSTGHAGDLLYLTKPLGMGIVTTAHKRGDIDPRLLDQAIVQMRTINRGAARAMRRGGVHAATDVTGFGLLGHLREMALASGLAARVDAAAVPLLPGIVELAAAGAVPGGTRRNLGSVAPTTDFAASIDETLRLVLADAQTSGGLLLAVPADRRGQLEAALIEEGVEAAMIGELERGDAGRIQVS